MHLLVDAQLPPALARWLADQGHRADHVADVGLLYAPDRDIWNYARDNRAALLTKDEDFAVWRNMASDDDPVVIWLRIGNSRKSDLPGWMEVAWPRVIAVPGACPRILCRSERVAQRADFGDCETSMVVAM